MTSVWPSLKKNTDIATELSEMEGTKLQSFLRNVRKGTEKSYKN